MGLSPRLEDLYGEVSPAHCKRFKHFTRALQRIVREYALFERGKYSTAQRNHIAIAQPSG